MESDGQGPTPRRERESVDSSTDPRSGEGAVGSLADVIVRVAQQSLALVAGAMLVGCSLYCFVHLAVVPGTSVGVAVTALCGVISGGLAWRFYREEAPLSRAHAYAPKGVSLSVTTDPEVPAIRGDAAEIQQIAMNLVTNAGEALGRAGQVQVRTGWVELGESEASALEPLMQRPAGEYVFVEVEDPGSGIASADQPKVFDPFFTRKAQGRGLGLAAVAGIVRRHRGGVRVASEPGVGTRIRVLFPRCEESPAAPVGEERVALAKRGLALVTDDEATVRHVARLTLERLGFAVEEAVDGASAVARIRQGARPVDVVLLDMTMPGQSGADTFRLLRALEPELPIVLNSGFDTEAMSAPVAEDPRAVFLAKPYRRGQLVAALDRVLDPEERTPYSSWNR